ncbi:MAG: sodium:solute symporter family protein, partial [Opitutaceae bacterium]
HLVGGLAGITSAVEPYRLSLATPKGIGPWFILMLTLNGLIGIAAQPHILATVGTGKDETACRAGFFHGNFVKRFCTIGWAITGLLVTVIVARGMFGDTSLPDAEDAFGYACRHLLFPGGVGLLIACVLAANMTTCSAMMVNSGALFTRSLYQRYWVRGRPDSHYLLVGRLSGLLVTVLAVVYAIFLIDRVLYAFLLNETVAAFVGISVLGGIFWRRANRWGALASVIASLATNFGLYYQRGQRLDHWEPDVFCIALLVGAASLVIVSLVTPAEPAKAIADYYRKLQTPSDALVEETALPGEPSASAEARQMRVTAEAGKQLLLVNLFQLRQGAAGVGFFRAYRADLKGFAVGWVITAGLVFFVWALFNV